MNTGYEAAHHTELVTNNIVDLHTYIHAYIHIYAVRYETIFHFLSILDVVKICGANMHSKLIALFNAIYLVTEVQRYNFPPALLRIMTGVHLGEWRQGYVRS
jgi:hypothetical protein